jgi:dTDP-4-dehydrorhamnose 3,5-epimerase-like enzyme
MNIVKPDIPGTLLFESRVWKDSRGQFMEKSRANVFEEARNTVSIRQE